MTSSEPTVHPAPPFAEHDKLGPLGAKASVLDNDHELRRVLVAEFAAAADAAREAAGKVDANLHTAVHDYRKALRRARAILALVASALPKSERRAVRRALQEARRGVSSTRDQAVAPEVIEGLALDELARDAANAIVANAKAALPANAELKQLLADGATRAVAQVEALEAALPESLDWDTIEHGVRATYDAARRARRAAKRSKRQFHTWRRRSKELIYQLDTIASLAGPHATELAGEIASLSDTQSPAVDLVMVRDFVRTYGQGVAPEAFDQLVHAIDSQLDELMRDSRRAGRDVFRRKPDRFARQLAKAVRKDLSPPATDDAVAG